MYQDDGPWYINGESNIYAENSDNTEIINQEFSHTFIGPAPAVNPDGKSNSYVQHQNIDNDPKVQEFIIDKLLEAIANEKK